MTRFPSAALLVLALALPPVAARAQSATLLDDAERATIEDYFKTQAEKNAAAEKARKAQQAKATDKGKKADKAKKAEKPKKPAKPKKAEKDKSKATDKNKANAKTNGKANPKANNGKAKPAAAAQLERGQVLAPDLPRRVLPKDLDSQLGKLPRGTQRVIVGGDVVLFERKTGKILDVMENAVKVGAVGR